MKSSKKSWWLTFAALCVSSVLFLGTAHGLNPTNPGDGDGDVGGGGGGGAASTCPQMSAILIFPTVFPCTGTCTNPTFPRCVRRTTYLEFPFVVAWVRCDCAGFESDLGA